jgi:hypothetical protein
MRDLQNRILSVYITIACLLMFIDFIFPAKPFVCLVKYITICSLFVISLCQQKVYKEQWMMFSAQCLVVLADYFFVFTKWIKGGQLANIHKYIGSICFFIAYLILIKTWAKTRYNKISLIEILFALLIIAFFWSTVIIIGPHLRILIKASVYLFGIVLCLLAWSGVCARVRNYYGRMTSCLIGMSSSLIFISDIAVVHAALNPAFAGQFVPWLSALIWITYIPAWAIIVILISLPNIYI